MLVTPRVIAAEAVRVLKGFLGTPNLVYRDFEKEFAAKIGMTVNVRKPSVFHSNTFEDQIELQDTNEETIPVVLDRLEDVSVPLSSTAQTLELVDFSKQYIQPAMKAIAEKVERQTIACIVDTASSEITANPAPDNLEDIAKLGEKLDDNLAPMEDRRLVLGVKHKYAYAITPNLSNVSYAGDNQTLRNAILGQVYGFETYMSQYVPKSTAKVAGNVKSYKITGNKGNKFVAVTSTDTASATIKKGDQFIIDGHIYRVTADAQAVSNAIARLEIDDKLHKTIAEPTAVRVINKPISVAFHKEAVAFVNRPLEKPAGAVKCDVVSSDGLSVRVTFDYDINKKQDIISFDILYGLSPLNGDLAVRLA